MRVLAVVVALAAFAGCLEIDSPDGTLMCSTVKGRECPAGFYCLQPNATCWRDGKFPADMSGPGRGYPPPPGYGNDDMSVPDEGDMSGPVDTDMMPPLD